MVYIDAVISVVMAVMVIHSDIPNVWVVSLVPSIQNGIPGAVVNVTGVLAVASVVVGVSNEVVLFSKVVVSSEIVAFKVAGGIRNPYQNPYRNHQNP